MNVTLPDGTTVENVPDGMSQKDLVAKLSRNGMDTSWYKEPKQSVLPKSTNVKEMGAEVLAEMPWYQRAMVGVGKAGTDVLNTFGLGTKYNPQLGEAVTDDTAGFAGNLVGEIGVTALPAGSAYKTVRAAQLLPKAAMNIAAGGAAAGAVSEGMLNRDPVTGAIIGGAAAPVMTVAGKGVSKGVEAIQRIAGGAEGEAARRATGIFGNRTPAVISALRNTKPIVPGEVVTAGKAATSEFPELAVLESRARAGNQAAKFTQADEATARARTKVLEDIEAPGVRPINPSTGRVGESAVESLRSGATGPLYQQAMTDLVPIPVHLERAMLGSGSVGTATGNAMRDFTEAVRLARAGGQPVPAGGRAAPGRPFQQMSIDQLQRVMRELNNIPPAQRDFNVTNALSQLSTLMRKQSPNYGTAQDMFRTMSAPQNRADVAGVLRNRMNESSNDLNQRATAFTNALRDAPQTIKKADLSPRFQTIDEVFAGAPDELQGIRNVEKSLMRERAADSLPKSRGIVPEYRSVFDELENAMPNTLTRVMSYTRSILKKAGGMSDTKVQRVVDDALTDPNKFADLMERVPASERNKVINMIRNQSDNIVGATVGPTTQQLRKME